MISNLSIISKIKSSFAQIPPWLQHKAIPFVHHTAEQLLEKSSNQDGLSHWTALTPSRRWSSLVIWTLTSVAGFGIVWASFARIDETVQAMGKIEPLGTTLDIKAPTGGVIKKILVRDGELVEKDQALIEMDTTAAKARLKALTEVRKRTLVDLELSRAQLGVPVDIERLNLNQQRKLKALQSEFESRISAAKSAVEQAKQQHNSVKSRLSAKQKALSIREKILLDITPLVTDGAMSRSQYLKELQEVELLRGEVFSLMAEDVRSKEAVSETLNKLRNTESLTQIDFSSKVEESQKQISQLSNQISETKVTLDYQLLRSPAKGIVFDLQPSAPGYVVSSSEKPVLKIVPTDDLVARIFISNRDIGFVKVGQDVKVRIDAYPSSEFGQLDGVIKSIGSDALEPDEKFNYYRLPITVTLSSPALLYKGKDLPILSGMSVNANIILRQRPVIAIFVQRILPFWDSLERL